MEGPEGTDGGDERRVEEIVERAREALAAAGFAVRGAAFPFSMHHRTLRSRLRGPDGRKPTHAEVAALLREWAATGDFAEAYAWQAVAGAVEFLKAGDRVPPEIAASVAAAMPREGFARWARGRIRPAAREG